MLNESKDRFLKFAGIPFLMRYYRRFRHQLYIAGTYVARLSSRTISMFPSFPTTSSTCDEEKSDDLEANTLPIQAAHERDTSVRSPRMSDATAPGSPASPRSPGSPEPTSPVSASPLLGGDTPQVSGSNSPVADGKQLWKNALRTVKMRSAVTSNMAALTGMRIPRRQRTTSSTLASTFGERKKTLMVDEPVKAVNRSRIAALVPKLKCLETTHDIAAHQALVRHLQFSPNGKFLATSRYDFLTGVPQYCLAFFAF